MRGVRGNPDLEGRLGAARLLEEVEEVEMAVDGGPRLQARGWADGQQPALAAAAMAAAIGHLESKGGLGVLGDG